MYHILQNFWLAYFFDAVIGATAGWLFYKLFSEYRKPSSSPAPNSASNGELSAIHGPTLTVLNSALAAELEKYRNAYQQLSDERIAVDEEWQKRYRLYKDFCDDRIATMDAEVALLRSKPTDEERAQLYEQINTALADKKHWHSLYQASEDQLALVDQEAATLRSKVTVIDALEKDRAQLKAQIAEWAARFAEQRRELIECQRQIEGLCGDGKGVALEPPIVEDLSWQPEENIRIKLTTAQAEIAKLRSHLSTASFLQDQWRRRWHELESQLKQAQLHVVDRPNDAAPSQPLQDRALQQDALNHNVSSYRTPNPNADQLRAIA